MRKLEVCLYIIKMKIFNVYIYFSKTDESEPESKNYFDLAHSLRPIHAL